MGEILTTYMRLEDISLPAPSFILTSKASNQELYWASLVKIMTRQIVSDLEFKYPSQWRVLINFLFSNFLRNLKNRNFVRMILTQLSKYDENCDREDSDYEESDCEYSDCDEQHDFEISYNHCIKSEQNQKFTYHHLRDQGIQYFENRFAKFQISLHQSVEEYTVIMGMDKFDHVPLKNEDSNELIQLVRFFAEFHANFIQLNDSPADFWSLQDVGNLLQYFLPSNNVFYADYFVNCLYLLVLISLQSIKMFMTIYERFKKSENSSKKGALLSPAQQSKLEDLLRVVHLRAKIKELNELKAKAFFKVFSDIIDKDNISEQHYMLQQKLIELKQMDQETFTKVFIDSKN